MKFHFAHLQHSNNNNNNDQSTHNELGARRLSERVVSIFSLVLLLNNFMQVATVFQEFCDFYITKCNVGDQA